MQTKSEGVTTQMKALDEYIVMVLFVLSLKRVYFLANETQMWDHSNESSQRLHSNSTACVLSVNCFGRRNTPVKGLPRRDAVVLVTVSRLLCSS